MQNSGRTDWAITATWNTLEFSVGTKKDADSYPVDFYYNLKNNTDRSYPLVVGNLTPMAVLTDGNALSNEFGHYQASAPIIAGPAFIPPGGTARISIRISYQYQDGFTNNETENANKILTNLNHRLRELSGFAIFDEESHYRIDLPEGWKQNLGVKDGTETPKLSR
jgi:hypothetical protein